VYQLKTELLLLLLFHAIITTMVIYSATFYFCNAYVSWLIKLSLSWLNDLKRVWIWNLIVLDDLHKVRKLSLCIVFNPLKPNGKYIYHLL
jgi:hypothetical protein